MRKRVSNVGIGVMVSKNGRDKLAIGRRRIQVRRPRNVPTMCVMEGAGKLVDEPPAAQRAFATRLAYIPIRMRLAVPRSHGSQPQGFKPQSSAPLPVASTSAPVQQFKPVNVSVVICKQSEHCEIVSVGLFPPNAAARSEVLKSDFVNKIFKRSYTMKVFHIEVQSLNL